MTIWETNDKVVAHSVVQVDTAPSAPTKTPQEHGWVAKTGYNYTEYNKSNKQISEDIELANGENNEAAATAAAGLIETAGAVGGLKLGDWSGNAAVYEWSEEYGDIGPVFPALEKQLFGSEFHVKAGIEFEKIREIEVFQEGVTRLSPVRSFDDAGLHPAMLANVKLAGYCTPTPIQAYSMPAVFKGYDLIASAQTGSGKTAAFLIPILSKLMGKAKKLAAPRPNPATFQPGITPFVRAEPLVLIVCPNRELATQIFDEARRFCYRTMLRPCVIYGGGPVVEQFNQLQKGCDVLIGTPGRLCDFIDRPHILTLKRLRYIVIDEADEMVHSDWDQELGKIMNGGDQETGNIKYMMFSATFPKVARELAARHLAPDHCRIRVGRAGSTHRNLIQNIIQTDPAQKRSCLLDLLMSLPPSRTIIFVNSKRTCDEVDDHIFNSGLPCTSIHSDRTQREREDSIRAFRMGKCPILIATGVSARGLDIANVSHVINYDLPSPQYGGIDEYMHRIGRTGRIGNKGLATSFFTDRDEDLADALVKTLLETNQPIPEFLESHIPEGFIPGETDPSTLKFELSDEEEADEGNTEGEGGVWGASEDAPAASGGGWGADADAAPAKADDNSGWNSCGGAGW
ncbi:putative ATP-dependent RNA helicase ded1 [Amylocarpus encephaloides]|uniref:RNA helicase n=1 Tax=Amylocarpus encephaloides TaxID=45428 RepID=A0A9P7YCA8_9HELO|nr:putative ATP-dependent RNA helicase ded1 [Amylocarpus encephaloides]